MKKKQILIYTLILALSAALSGCGDDSYTASDAGAQPGGITAPYWGDATGPDYDWISGESPIPGRRIGLYRSGIMSLENGFECTDTGVYFMCDIGPASYLLYGDHDSNTIIKLCGRPDCDHNNSDCNAYFESAENVCYYGGYLYTLSDPPGENPRLVRMDPDGSNQITVLEIYSQAGAGKIYTGWSSPVIWNGVFIVYLTYLDDAGQRQGASCYYKLDGSMENMELANANIPFMNDGDNFIMFGAADGNTQAAFNTAGEHGYYIWDHSDNSLNFLHNQLGYGYYGAEDAYYIRGGVIYHLNYAEDQEEAVLDTGLSGAEEYENLACFPDCLVVSTRPNNKETGEASDRNWLYFYNWDFEALGQVELEFTQGSSIAYMSFIAGETPERLILTDSVFCVPRYYIEKSDFGTGHIEIHEYNMPDVDWSEIGG